MVGGPTGLVRCSAPEQRTTRTCCSTTRHGRAAGLAKARAGPDATSGAGRREAAREVAGAAVRILSAMFELKKGKEEVSQAGQWNGGMQRRNLFPTRAAQC